jgi:hypothetical protein
MNNERFTMLRCSERPALQLELEFPCILRDSQLPTARLVTASRKICFQIIRRLGEKRSGELISMPWAASHKIPIPSYKIQNAHLKSGTGESFSSFEALDSQLTKKKYPRSVLTPHRKPTRHFTTHPSRSSLRNQKMNRTL